MYWFALFLGIYIISQNTHIKLPINFYARVLQHIRNFNANALLIFIMQTIAKSNILKEIKCYRLDFQNIKISSFYLYNKINF